MPHNLAGVSAPAFCCLDPDNLNSILPTIRGLAALHSTSPIRLAVSMLPPTAVGALLMPPDKPTQDSANGIAMPVSS